MIWITSCWLATMIALGFVWKRHPELWVLVVFSMSFVSFVLLLFSTQVG